MALQKLNLPTIKLNIIKLPQRPIIIDIAMSCSKGCNMYSKLISKKSTLNNKMYLREEKWHSELGQHFSVDFWENANKLHTKIDFDNQLKWLQYQIVRNCLQTNAIVSKFKPNISKACSYCQRPDSVELISHLFWTCPIVTDFLNDVFTLISNTGTIFSPSKVQFLFGVSNYEVFQPQNYISLVLKKYIWQTKFKSKNLAIDRFKALLKSYINDLKFMFDYKDMSDRYNDWYDISENL